MTSEELRKLLETPPTETEVSAMLTLCNDAGYQEGSLMKRRNEELTISEEAMASRARASLDAAIDAARSR